MRETRRLGALGALIIIAALSATISCGGKATVDPPAAPAASTAEAPGGALPGLGEATGGASSETTPPATPATVAQPTVAQPTAASPTTASPPEAATLAAPGSAGAPAGATAPAPSAAPKASPSTRLRRLGEIVFAEGEVSLHRAGAEPRRVDIGETVRAYDVLVTGPKSRAEIDLGSGAGGGATVKLSASTAFYFDSKELDDATRSTALQLLSGAIAVKVDRLANGSFRVATDEAVLGVRGTVFIADTMPDGSLLVTCDSGAVAVSAGGATTTAKPGGVVELTGSGGLRLLAVQPEDLADYRGLWRADAYKAFSPRALTVASTYAAALDAGRPAFASALARLDAQAQALAAWRNARDSGHEPRFGDWIAEKKAVSAVLFDCLKALFAIERPYYRLLELRALHAEGIGVGTLRDGRSSAAFYGGFDASTRDLAAGMARVREALGLFSWAAAGSPLGDFFGAKAEGLGTGAIFAED